MRKSVTLTIDGVGLKMNPNGVSFYPDGIHPYDHQVKMAEILTSPEDFVAVNTAPTGGGKTWSWAIPIVENKMTALVVLPTNALIADQHRAIEEYKEDFTDEDDALGTLMLTGQTASRLKQKWGLDSKGEAISEEIKELTDQNDAVVVLTNPDIFTYLRGGKYHGSMAKHATNEFDAVIFDEFHIADTKGWNSLLYLIDEMYASNHSLASKFVFLSATPDEAVENRLKNGVSIPNYANCTAETKRDDPDDPGRLPWLEAKQQSNWKAVMPPVEAEFRPGHTFATGGHLLSDENMMDTLDFVTQGKTVIMLDSLAEVDLVYRELSSHLPGKNVYRIDGFNKNDIAHKLRTFDILVSNSAVEVGIDFDVEQLVMSGYTKSRFLQRIGRLRNNNETLKAIAYVPESVYDALVRAKRMYGDRAITRENFRKQLDNWFPEPENPAKYPEMYSAIEAFIHIEKKMNQMTPERRTAYKPDAYQRVYNHFFKPADVQVTTDDLQALINKARSPLNNEDGRAFHETLTGYRNSGINALVYKASEHEVLSYNLFYLLKQGDIEFVPKSEFYRRVPKQLHYEARSEDPHSIGYCIYRGPRQKPANGEEDVGRRPRLSATNTLRELTQLDPEDREPVSVTGLEVKVGEHIPGLDLLNEALAEEEFLCYPIEGNSYDVQQQYNLNKFFFLQDLTDLRGNYSLALGLNALYMHCHVLETEESMEDRQMIRQRN